MYARVWLFLSLVLLLCNAEIDEKVISKDLYAALGVSQDASASDIKKAYRALARKYHPDKAKSEEEKEENERRFVEIAEAHEVLVDENARGEYDYHRQFASVGGRGRGSGHSGGGARPDATGGDGMYYYDGGYMFGGGTGGADMFEMFEDFFSWGSTQYTQQQYQQHGEFVMEQDIFDMFFGGAGGGGVRRGEIFEEPQFQPTVTESPLRSNEIITPYSPIIMSADQSHYSFLDATCSFKVFSYKNGDIGNFVQLLAENPVSMHLAPGVTQKFKTPEFPSLDGNCFAALDESGAFSVFQGHPQFEYQAAWTTKEWNEGDEQAYYASMERRYFLHVTNDGELTVMSLPGSRRSGRMRRSQGKDDRPPECTWSSKGCPDEFQGPNTLRILRKTTLVTFKLISSALRFVRAIPRYIDDGLEMWEELGPVEFSRVALVSTLTLLKRVLLHLFA